MLKVLLWVVSNDYRFLNGAINILDRQHKGIEVVDTVKGTDFSKVDGGGIMKSSSSGQNKSA